MDEMRAPDESMDLRGVPCPGNFARVLLRLEGMAGGALLEVIVDDGEPIDNVPRAVLDEGHEVVARERAGDAWRLLVKCCGETP